MPSDPVESFRARLNGRNFIYIESYSDPEEFEIDDLVTIDIALTGIIQFISSAMIGVRLIGTSVQRGDTDGSDSTGKRYFSCPQNDGMLVSPRRVVKRQLTKLDKARFKDALAMEGILLPTKPLELPEEDAEPVLVKESRGKPQMLAKESRGNVQSYTELPSAEQSDSEESYDEDLWIPADYGSKQNSDDEDLWVPDDYKGKKNSKQPKSHKSHKPRKARKPAPVVQEKKKRSASSKAKYMANIKEERDSAPVSEEKVQEPSNEVERQQLESEETAKLTEELKKEEPVDKVPNISEEKETEPGPEKQVSSPAQDSIFEEERQQPESQEKSSMLTEEPKIEPLVEQVSDVGQEKGKAPEPEEQVQPPEEDTNVEEEKNRPGSEEKSIPAEESKPEEAPEGKSNVVGQKEEVLGSKEELIKFEKEQSTTEARESLPFEVEAKTFALQEQNKVLEERCEELKRALAAAQQERLEADKESKKVADTLAEHNESKEKENGDLKEEVTHLKQSLYHTNEKLRASEHREESLLTRIQIETEALKQMEGSSALEKELSEAKARNGKLRIRVQQLEDEYQSVEYLEEQNEELKKVISKKDKAFQKEMGQFEELLHASQTVQNQIREHCGRLEEENIHLEDRLIASEQLRMKDLSDHKLQTGQLEEKIAELQKQLSLKGQTTDEKIEEERERFHRCLELTRKQAEESARASEKEAQQKIDAAHDSASKFEKESQGYKLRISALEKEASELQKKLSAGKQMSQKQATEVTNQKEAYYNAIDSKDRFEQVLKMTQEHCVILEKRTLNFEKEKKRYEAHMQERLSHCENEKNEMKEQLEDTEKKYLATLKKMEEENKFTLYRADNLERELQRLTLHMNADMNKESAVDYLSKDTNISQGEMEEYITKYLAESGEEVN